MNDARCVFCRRPLECPKSLIALMGPCCAKTFGFFDFWNDADKDPGAKECAKIMAAAWAVRADGERPLARSCERLEHLGRPGLAAQIRAAVERSWIESPPREPDPPPPPPTTKERRPAWERLNGRLDWTVADLDKTVWDLVAEGHLDQAREIRMKFEPIARQRFGGFKGVSRERT